MSTHFLPIDTAPINGELIILARLDADGEVEELDAGLWEHDAGQDTSNGYIEPSHYWCGLRGEMHPTHWCPMPGTVDPSQADLLAENVSLKSELREARVWLEGKEAVIKALSHRAGTCQVPPKGWACTREAGHTGPCAAFPTTIPDETV